ncbi:hypothetical protein CEXT_500401 [Caerostris extrusa]|uniref:Uncharacterized protein n=1 Tax=Caerostris extrusa TaxID=172846 RepID=A0AAV4PJ05_CAEEX|nr:hypothetical protein CEXT_500401 [Caerostris extrusa]
MVHKFIELCLWYSRSLSCASSWLLPTPPSSDLLDGGGPVGLAAGPWGLAGKGWGAAPYGYYGNGAIAGNGILSSGWRGTWGGVAPSE